MSTRYFEDDRSFLGKLLGARTDAPIVRLTRGSHVITPDGVHGKIVDIDRELGALVDTGADFDEWFQAQELRAA